MTKMILANTEGQGYATYSPPYVAMAYKMPTHQNYLTEGWLKDLNLDVVEIVKRMTIPRKNFRTRPSEKYETAYLHTPYRLIALMLNIIFGRENGNNFKIGWVLVIVFVATQGTIFNWENIVSNSLSYCISAALGRVSQKKSEFYMSSVLIDCILCTHPFPSLKCQWDKDKSLVYVAYQLLWAHKYFSHYKSICEDFIMPLYRLIFLSECDCMS